MSQKPIFSWENLGIMSCQKWGLERERVTLTIKEFKSHFVINPLYFRLVSPTEPFLERLNYKDDDKKFKSVTKYGA